MMKLVFATHNPHKAEELKQMMPLGYTLVSLADMQFEEEIPETGSTLEENALIKAHHVAKATGEACFADDTGLEVEALEGAPGVYSARYAGADASSRENIDKLLEALKGTTERFARFRTVVAYINPRGREYFFEGTVKGRITKKRWGQGGFGYDPVFQPEGYRETFAQMSAQEKNEISHRGRAVRSFMEFLRNQKN